MIDPRYNRTFADKFNEWTGQPVFWAAIASLGLHGILFAALPSFSSGTPDLDDRTVSVVELSGEDLQRLPDFPELDIPDLPNVEDPYDFELDPLENWDDVLKDLGIEAEESEAVIPSSPGLLSPLPRSPLLPPPIAAPQPLPWSFADSLPRIPTRDLSPSTDPAPSTPSQKEPETDNPPVSNNDGGSPDPEPESKETPPLTEEQIQELQKERLDQLVAENQRKGQAIADYLGGAQQVNNLVNKWIDQEPQGMATDPLLVKEVALPLEACAAGQDAKANLYVTVGRNNQVIEKNGDLPNPIFSTLTASEYITSGGKHEGQYFDADAYKLLDEEALNVVQNYDYSQASTAGQKRWYVFEVNFIYDGAACSEYLAQQAVEASNSSSTDDNSGSTTPSSIIDDSGASTDAAGPTAAPPVSTDDAEATPPQGSADDIGDAETTPSQGSADDTDDAEATTPSPESMDDSGTAEDLL